MRFYLTTSFIFPRSFRLRVFAVCFVATHVPLLCFLAWSGFSGRLALPEAALLVAATVAGAGLALYGIGRLLDPIHAAADALAALEQGSAANPLPQRSEDMVGDLLASVNRAVHAAESRLQALDMAAKEDVLTGVRNRRGFLADLEALVPEARCGTVALIDLDLFKQVNDRLGHDEGDRVLRSFAARLSSELRRSDLLARWGGEEFAVLFRDTTEADAAQVLSRIAERLTAEPLLVLDGRPLTFSAGVSRLRAAMLDDTLRAADEALYEAKRAGRGRVRRASLDQPALPLR